jgi:V8-like Glu-specific endopeptidase
MREDAARIVDQAGIPAAHVAFQDKAINNWHEILTQAANRNQIPALVREALKDFPENEYLKLALKGEFPTVKQPKLAPVAPLGSGHLEKIIRIQSTLVPITFLEVGLQKACSVAKVELPDGESGSGFLTNGNLLITNHHVLPDKAIAEKSTARFNYQTAIDGRELRSERLQFDPDAGFVTSAKHDWTAVRLKRNANALWGALPLSRARIKVDDRVNIIQHPAGGHKQISFFHNVVVFVEQGRVQYLTDTLPGSSGSPVFDKKWNVVAVHRSGGELPEPGSNEHFYRNEGVHINVLISGLRKANLLAA